MQQATDATGTTPASTGAGRRPARNAAPGPATYGPDELVNAGHKFFGNVLARDLLPSSNARVSQWGLPNGYVLGEEASGRVSLPACGYGEGHALHPRTPGDLAGSYWQGTIGRLRLGRPIGARTHGRWFYNLPANQRDLSTLRRHQTGSAYIVRRFSA